MMMMMAVAVMVMVMVLVVRVETSANRAIENPLNKQHVSAINVGCKFLSLGDGTDGDDSDNGGDGGRVGSMVNVVVIAIMMAMVIVMLMARRSGGHSVGRRSHHSCCPRRTLSQFTQGGSEFVGIAPVSPCRCMIRYQHCGISLNLVMFGSR